MSETSLKLSFDIDAKIFSEDLKNIYRTLFLKYIGDENEMDFSFEGNTAVFYVDFLYFEQGDIKNLLVDFREAQARNGLVSYWEINRQIAAQCWEANIYCDSHHVYM